MNIFQAIILGALQGLTEFLPVSSSAHLSIFSGLLGVGDLGAAFTAVIQIGTEAAIIVYFWKDIVRILSLFFSNFIVAVKGGPGKFSKLPKDAKLGWYIILGTVPIVVLGVLLQNAIEGVFRTLWLTAIMLIVFGIIIYLADIIGAKTYELDNLTTKHTVLFGLAQCLALIPGVSRSGSTIAAGRLLGYSRTAAAKFSFYLAIPSVFGAGLLELKTVFSDIDAATAVGFPGWVVTIIATIISFVVGYIVIAAFMRLLDKISFKPFAIYRVALGVIVLILLVTGVLA